MKVFRFSNPVKPEELKKAYEDGMVRKEDLINRAYYSGHCRNASAAIWIASLDCFIYLRHKFGSSFAERINHPANDDGFDIFKPDAKIDISVPEVFEKFKSSLPTAEDISYILEHEIRILRNQLVSRSTSPLTNDQAINNIVKELDTKGKHDA